MSPAVIVFGDPRHAGRTLRALRGGGLEPIDATASMAAALAALTTGPVWLVRAGAWPVRAGAPPFPPPSATGKPLVALSAILAPPCGAGFADAERWTAILAQSGGDLSRVATTPPIAGAYCEARPARAVAERVAAGQSFAEALASVCDPSAVRLVRYAPLDLFDDDRLRVVLAVTSLQQGGAERVVIDLHETLGQEGIFSLIVTIGRPTRAAFTAPPAVVDVAGAGPRREDRIDALAEVALAQAADLVHAHLLTGDDLARLAAHPRAVPTVVTVHNTREGWPENLGAVRADQAALLVACSLAAERDLREAALPVPIRTAWNGIDTAPFRAADLRREAAAFRRRLRIDPSDLVLLVVANPRPQKRLHLLPEVLAAAQRALEARGNRRRARLVVVGDADPRTEPAATSMRRLRDAIAEHGLGDDVHLVGSMAKPLPAIAAADVLVSASAHEGLSLAHLEALAAGVPVVATDAGGTRELAGNGVAIEVLPRDAAPARLAEAAIRAALDRPAGAAFPEHFSRRAMASRYASLYPRALAAGRRASRRGLVLVTNNLSTGGAQSSARRLLATLADGGVHVRAALLEEQPAFPTPGRRALEAVGISVLALPPPDRLDPAAAVARLLAWIDDDPPEAILFWNALAEHKIRLADAILDVPVFDVSPGEMYFASLDRYLAKPRAALPYRDAKAYGSRLSGVIVKYAAEAPRAAEALGAPVHVIPNGVGLGERPTPRTAGGGRIVFGTAARLSPQKKIEALLDAFHRVHAELPPYELRIAGAPERGAEAYAEGLRERAHGLCVTWVGEVSDARPFLADLDVFAMISEPAGCPNASIEAMAAGLPVVATDVGGASEQVIDGLTGRLVPRDDTPSLAAAILDLARDPALRRRFGEASRARAEARFDVRRMVADYLRVCLGDAAHDGGASARSSFDPKPSGTP
ncbi:Glycosyl transferase, group 1 [Minicystis rosea]|nr:Glycosyl transferase, group 1 [Minicystis rosea]